MRKDRMTEEERRRATSRVCTRYPIDGAVQKAKCGTAWSARDAAYSMVAGIDPDPLKRAS